MFIGPTTVTSHVISGDKALTYALDAADAAALNSINASASTGGVSADVSAGIAKAAFTFTGGSGNDSIKLKDDAFVTLTAGTQLNGGTAGTDKIGILDIALTTAETAKLNASVGFEVLGLNANITLDASTLTSIKQFSVDTTKLTQTINNMATGSTATLDAAAPTSLTLAGATGVSDVTIALGTSTSTGNMTVGTLVTTGLTKIALSSNGSGTNAITTLTNSDNSNITVTGTQDLTMTFIGTAIGSVVNGSGMSGKLSVSGSNGAAYNDVLTGGAGADTITGRSGADKMTGNSGADTFVFDGTTDANINGAVFGSYDEITDFSIGSDKLQFTNQTGGVSGQQAAVQTAVTALPAGSTESQIATAMATANTDLGVSFAVFGGNAYARFEAAGASMGDVTDDVFIKLTGLTTVPTFAADVVA
jgi:Ca2+-binding RTX toxin-like protein